MSFDLRRGWIPSVFLGVILAAGCSPSNRADCIKSGSKSGMTEIAARELVRACKEQFPDPKKVHRPVAAEELAKITGRAGPTYSGQFSGQLYNGAGATLCQVGIVVVTQRDDGATDKRVYSVDLDIQPNQARDFGFDYIAGKDGKVLSWGIESAEQCVQ